MAKVKEFKTGTRKLCNFYYVPHCTYQSQNAKYGSIGKRPDYSGVSMSLFFKDKLISVSRTDKTTMTCLGDSLLGVVYLSRWLKYWRYL